jgi:RNA polymerase sigma-70 factor (ECF subfamily)
VSPNVDPSNPPGRIPGDPAAAEQGVLALLDRDDRRGALTALMRLYGDAIYRHCYGTLLDADLAADVHQTVFVEAWRDLPRFHRRSSFKTWLFAIARHRCLDALKIGRRRRARFTGDEDAPEPVDPTRDAESDLAARSDLPPLENCLGGLRAESRTAVLLRFQEAMSYEDMGKLTGELPGSLQARVARAMPVLRKCLEAAGVSL